MRAIATRAALLAAFVLITQSAKAQQTADSGFWPAAESAEQEPGPPPGLPTIDEGKKNWLLRSPLVDVPWPQIKMPKLKWKTGEKSGKPGPLKKMTQATHNAFSRTRTAWNKTVDKLKVGPFRPKQNGGEPSFFAKLFGGSQEEDRKEVRTVSDFMKQDRPQLR